MVGLAQVAGHGVYVCLMVGTGHGATDTFGRCSSGSGLKLFVDMCFHVFHFLPIYGFMGFKGRIGKNSQGHRRYKTLLFVKHSLYIWSTTRLASTL